MLCMCCLLLLVSYTCSAEAMHTLPHFCASASSYWQVEALCYQPVLPSVHTSVRPLPKLRPRYFENKRTSFDAKPNYSKWTMGQRHDTIGFGGQEVSNHEAEDRFGGRGIILTLLS